MGSFLGFARNLESTLATFVILSEGLLSKLKVIFDPPRAQPQKASDLYLVLEESLDFLARERVRHVFCILLVHGSERVYQLHESSPQT